MPRHVVMALLALCFLVFSTSALFSWVSVHLRLPLVEDFVLSLYRSESSKAQEKVDNNLQLMATRLGELQARVLQLNELGDRLGGLAGLKKDGQKEVVSSVPAKVAGQGGAYVPAPMTPAELQKEIERLAGVVDASADNLAVLESLLLEKKVRDRLLPTTLPVADASIGSSFGYRSDPIAGLRAMHEGIDFVADTGTPVVAAADGVVISADYHSEFGNVIDIDHGDGLISRYAHLSKINIKAGSLVKRGELLGAVGTTGRSTGPHLHFEVRMLGVPQNPAVFLKQGAHYAQLKKR
jgi:murein DD-endopeptidase MepM/ murein hydrolase activator NlpD